MDRFSSKVGIAEEMDGLEVRSEEIIQNVVHGQRERQKLELGG